MPTTGKLLVRLVAATPSAQPTKPPTLPVLGVTLVLMLLALLTFAVVDAACAELVLYITLCPT